MIITVEILKNKGYNVSTLKDANSITLAASDVKLCYFKADETFEEESVINLLCALTYSLLLRRKIVATRYGSTVKTNNYSAQADEDQVTKEVRGYCIHRLEIYTAANGNEIKDIIKLYDELFYIPS
jgi:hypothetical protein